MKIVKSFPISELVSKSWKIQISELVSNLCIYFAFFQVEPIPSECKWTEEEEKGTNCQLQPCFAGKTRQSVNDWNNTSVLQMVHATSTTITTVTTSINVPYSENSIISHYRHFVLPLHPSGRDNCHLIIILPPYKPITTSNKVATKQNYYTCVQCNNICLNNHCISSTII